MLKTPQLVMLVAVRKFGWNWARRLAYERRRANDVRTHDAQPQMRRRTGSVTIVMLHYTAVSHVKQRM